ncbi:hypothetical protein AC249_AIPGENE5510 [Exaiptasia diaphana]|nr:hypothetical protein AC249_AIPGENE5510 [Exaiptasia diaphana]
MPRFCVGLYQKKNKHLKEQLVDKEKTIKDLNAQISEKESEIRAKRAKLQRLNEKVDSLVKEAEELDSIRQDLAVPRNSKSKHSSSRSVNARRKKPSGLDLKSTTSRKRRRETMEAAVEINGGVEGARYGLVDTVDKHVRPEKIAEAIEKGKCNNIKNKAFPKVYKKALKEFEKSDDNMYRSVGVYYSKSVMGKNKYLATYKCNSFKKVKGKRKSIRLKVSGCPIPKLVPYYRLMSFINDINIGTLHSVRENLCNDLDDKEKVDGAYRNLEEVLINVDSLVKEAEELDSIRQDLAVPRNSKSKYLSSRSVNARRKKPSGLDLKSTTSRKRRRETMEAAVEINGGVEGARYGLVDTVDKHVRPEKIAEAIEKGKCNNIKNKAFPKVYKKALKEFEKSDDNMYRSVGVYYSKSVMGKNKYLATYKCNSFKKVKGKRKSIRLKVSGCPIPKLVPYYRLMSFINDINIGTLHSVRENLCNDLDDKEKVDGAYRNLEEVLVNVCSFYLNNPNTYKLYNFTNDDTCTFYVAIGGDGAPCGKDDTAVAWLVSILNIGQRVLSSSENFLLFGANCNENCLPVRRFVIQLMKDVEEIERKTYTINLKDGTTRKIKFLISEFPNDMKMLCFLSGELSNSATYFSSFADIPHASLKTKSVISDTFGLLPSNTWKPWKYSHRIKVAKDVEKFKVGLDKGKVAESTRRTKITKFIAEKKSRQEFQPLIGKRVNNIHVDSLHLKNNACAYAHRHFLDEVLNQCSQDIHQYSCFSKLPVNCKFVRYIEILKTKCSLSRLAKKVIKWFEDSKGASTVTFDYRFTGKDSRQFLFNFMYLIELLEEGTTGKPYRLRIFGLALICYYLRNAVSLFTRVHITDEQVSDLKQLCSKYLRANFVFYSVNPTVWTVGLVVPSHTADMKAEYGMGLGLNSMEGREAKHQAIGKFAKNTFYMKRWEQIFRHEYVSLLWLREMGFDLPGKLRRQTSYIPKRTSKPSYCVCGFDKDENNDKCRFCSHPMMIKAQRCVEKGKWAQ